MVTRRVTFSLVVLTLAAVHAAASSRTASFSVSAEVVPQVWMEAVDEPAVELTSIDLARGYKVVDVHYRVHTTGTTRYLLGITPRTGLATRVHIEGLGAPVTLEQTDITVLQHATAKTSELRLRLRLELSQGIATGTHVMPVRLAVSAS